MAINLAQDIKLVVAHRAFNFYLSSFQITIITSSENHAAKLSEVPPKVHLPNPSKTSWMFPRDVSEMYRDCT